MLERHGLLFFNCNSENFGVQTMFVDSAIIAALSIFLAKYELVISGLTEFSEISENKFWKCCPTFYI